MRRHVLIALVAVLVLVLSTGPAANATTPVEPTMPAPPTTVAEGFDVDTDCINNSIQRPGCGSEDRGGAGQYLTFGVMILGMALIGWRIAVAVRNRDRAVSPDA